MSSFMPAEVFCPGEYIQEEMEARGWSQEDLARILDKPLPTVNRIIKGKVAITPDTAKRLGAAFGNAPQFWLNLEAQWQLHATGDTPLEDVRARAAIYEAAPVREMARRKWIANPKSSDDVRSELCKHFGVHDLNEVPALRVAARASVRGASDELTASQWAWVCQARRMADLVDASRFTKTKLRSCIEELAQLTTEPEQIRHVPRVLAEAGIRLVVVKHLKGTKLDGAALHRNASQPVIALSLRFGRLDNFWFTLMHELAHVLKDDGVRADADIYAASDQVVEEERIANELAASWLVPQEKLESFINRTTPLYSVTRVQNFAKRIGIHPSIVAGQLRFRGELPWEALTRLNVDVRQLAVDSNISDGWGKIAPVK